VAFVALVTPFDLNEGLQAQCLWPFFRVKGYLRRFGSRVVAPKTQSKKRKIKTNIADSGPFGVMQEEVEK